MIIAKTALTALLAAGIGAAVVPAAADVGVSIDIGPPAVRYEPIPPPRSGYVWVPGYWDWVGRRHVWVGGTWVRSRPGYIYHTPGWVQRGGHWELERGAWARPGGDEDHDGIRNRRDRDRDGDHVPNRRDARPGNPRHD